MVLIAFPTGGNAAPAATATNPAIRAYSIKSCPRVSRQRTNLKKMVMANGISVGADRHSGMVPETLS